MTPWLFGVCAIWFSLFLSISVTIIFLSLAIANILCIEPCFSPLATNILFISLPDSKSSNTAFLPST